MIGTTVWKRQLHQPGRHTALAVADRQLVVLERHTRLVCLDRADGSVNWDVPAGTWPRGLVVASDRCLVLPQTPDRLSCHDLRSGAPVWRVQLPGFTGHLVVHGNTVVVGGWRGYTPLAAFDLRDGRPLWRTSEPVATTLPVSWGGGLLLGSGSAAWLIDPLDGTELTRWQLPEPLPDGDQPVLTLFNRDRCLARVGSRSVATLQLSSGRVDQLVRHDRNLLPCAAEISGGLAWLREGRAGFLVVDPTDGSARWRLDLGLPLAPGVARTDSGFVVASESGALLHLGSGGELAGRTQPSRRISALRDLGPGRAALLTKGTLQVVS
ncbi:outer membrane protein assembly factor BamB family protein [Kitasatospora sp. P5_F3]